MAQTGRHDPDTVVRGVSRARRARRWRRAGTLLLIVLVLAGVAGLYGPLETTRTASSAWGEVSVTHPRVVRGGTHLVVTVEVAPTDETGPWTLEVHNSWVEVLGVDTVVPLPARQSVDGSNWLLVYNEPPSGSVLLSGRVPTHPEVGPVATTVGVRDRAATTLDLRTWVLP